MMKFPLDILHDRIILSVLFDAPSYRIRLKRIGFCIDTGSPKTYISSGTANIIKIPLSHLNSGEGITRLGGVKFSSFIMKNVELKLKTDQSSLQSFKIPEIEVLNPTKTTEEAKNVAYSTPSIVGLDFLRENNLKFYCDIAKDEAYLED